MFTYLSYLVSCTHSTSYYVNNKHKLQIGIWLNLHTVPLKKSSTSIFPRLIHVYCLRLSSTSIVQDFHARLLYPKPSSISIISKAFIYLYPRHSCTSIQSFLHLYRPRFHPSLSSKVSMHIYHLMYSFISTVHGFHAPLSFKVFIHLYRSRISCISII